MKILSLVTLIVTLVLGPFTVSGALSSLPIGSKEKVVEYTTQVDFVNLSIWIMNSDWDYSAGVTEIYNHSFNRFTGDDGRTETFYDMSRRSRSDFEKTLSFMMRSIVSDLLKQSGEKTLLDASGNPLSLENKNVELSYSGNKMTSHVQFDSFFSARGRGTVVKNSTGELVLPEESYKLDLEFTVMGGGYGYGYVSLLVPDIQNARVTLKDEYGNILQVLEGTEQFAKEGITVSTDWNEVVLPLSLATSGTLGEFRVWYTSGAEQVFDLSNGTDLITYLTPEFAKGSPFRRLGVPKVTVKGLELPFEAKSNEIVFIRKASSVLKTWETISTNVFIGVASLGKTNSLRFRVAVVPLSSPFGLYQASFSTNAIRSP